MTQIQRFHLTKRYSEAAIYNNVVYLAGQVPENSGEEVYAQTQEVLGLIDKLLSEANSDSGYEGLCRNESSVGRMGRSEECAASSLRGSKISRSEMEGRNCCRGGDKIKQERLKVRSIFLLIFRPHFFAGKAY